MQMHGAHQLSQMHALTLKLHESQEMRVPFYVFFLASFSFLEGYDESYSVVSCTNSIVVIVYYSYILLSRH